MLPVFVLLSSHRVSLVGYVSFVWQPFTSDKLQWMRALLHCYTWAGLMHIIFMMSGRLPSDHTLCWQGNATLLHNTTFFNDSVWVRWLGCMYQIVSPQTLQYVPCGLQENNGLTLRHWDTTFVLSAYSLWCVDESQWRWVLCCGTVLCFGSISYTGTHKLHVHTVNKDIDTHTVPSCGCLSVLQATSNNIVCKLLPTTSCE